MTAPAHRELRDGETIRAYLEELARLQTPVQMWLPGADAAPFRTTLAKVSPITFSIATTPQLEPGQILNLSFMLDARRFVTQGKVVTPGVFRIPLSIAQGERREHLRATFGRDEPGRVFAVEAEAGGVLQGRFLLGRLLDLSPGGLRVGLEEVGHLDLDRPALALGDQFGCLRISDLPFTPAIHGCGGVCHLGEEAGGPFAGLRLEGCSERDRVSLERLLIPRRPATFGEAFPTRKRKTDFADQLGPPTQTQVRIKAPEVEDRVLATAEAPSAPARSQPTAVMRLRRASRNLRHQG